MRQDEIRNDVLVLCMKGLIYHSLLCVVYNVASEKTLQMDLRLLILYVPLLLFAVIRRKCEKFSVFMLLHTLISGVSILIFPGLEDRIVIGGASVFLAVVSIHMRTRGEQEEEECPPIASLLIFLVSYIAASQMNRLQAVQICYYEVFLFLILFVAYKNLSSTTIFLKSNERMANLPVRQMKGINQSLLSVFILVLTIGMVFVPYLPVRQLFDGFGQLLKMILRKILLLFLWIFTRDDSQMEFLEKSAQGQIGAIEAGETSVLAQFFELLLIVAAAVVLAAGAVYLVIRILYELYQKFYEKNQELADESEFIWENPMKIRVVRNRQKKQMLTENGMNYKIRRLYKRNIRKQFGMKAVIPAFMTPTELEQLLEEKYMVKKNMEDTEKIDTAVSDEKRKQRIQLYQKARYSQHECVKQELEVMKQSL